MVHSIPGLYDSYKAPIHVLVVFYILLVILILLYVVATIRNMMESRLLLKDR